MWHKNEINKKKKINKKIKKEVKSKRKKMYKNVPLLEFIKFNMIVLDFFHKFGHDYNFRCQISFLGEKKLKK